MNDFKTIAAHKAAEGSYWYSESAHKDGREIEVTAERMYDGSTLYTAWLTTSADIYEHQFKSADRLNCYLHSQGFYGISPVKF
jgi:hypothetical protein